MNKIYKYDLTPEIIQGLWSTDTKKVSLPESHMILDVQWNRGGIQLWVQIDESTPLVEREFIIVGTGREDDRIAEEEIMYIGTVQQPVVSHPQVWHVYVRQPSWWER